MGYSNAPDKNVKIKQSELSDMHVPSVYKKISNIILSPGIPNKGGAPMSIETEQFDKKHYISLVFSVF